MPPTVLVILDDVGTEYLQCYGLAADWAVTPRLNALSAGGQRWTNMWATPACSPTRASIQTGLWPLHHGVGTVLRTETDPGLPLEAVTVAEVLAPIPSGIFGKWHLGMGAAEGGTDAPGQQGYTEAVVTRGNLNAPETYASWTWYRNGEEQPSSGYAPSATVDETLAWLAVAPCDCLAIAAFHLAHAPMHCPPAGLRPGSACSGGVSNMVKLRAMIEAMDTELGRLVDGLPAESIIIVIGDNGSMIRQPPVPENRAKGTVYQGGVNVPFIVSGPTVDPGVVSVQATATDLFPTICELVGVTPPEGLDGMSLVPVFADSTATLGQRFTWTERFEPLGVKAGDGTLWSRAARGGNFKLIRQTGTPEELYHLGTDPWEQTNLLTGSLTSGQQAAHAALSAFMDELEATALEF